MTFLLWSSAFPCIRFALRHLSPGHVTLLRFLTGGLALAAYAMVVGIRVPPRDMWPRVLVTALFATTIYHTCLNYGLVHVMSGAGGLIVNTAPVFTALGAVLLLRERVPAVVWAGIALSFSGTVVIALGQPGGAHNTWGALLLMGCALAWTTSTLLQKPMLTRMPALDLTAWSAWLGTIPLLVFAPGLVHAIRTVPLSATLAVVYIGVGPIAVACVTWAFALSRMPAYRLASLTYVLPVLNALMAWGALHEVPTPMTFLGGGLAAIGVTLVGLATGRSAANGARRSPGPATS